MGNGFYAMFTGQEERPNSVFLKKNDMYRVEYMYHDHANDWEWFRVWPVDWTNHSRWSRIMYGIKGDSWLGGGAATQIPYRSFSTFKDNWKMLYDENGNLITWRSNHGSNR